MTYVNPAQQERSRRTEQAIADALTALLREKPFPQITVAEIAQTARVSVGGLYARFTSKEALLALVQLDILEQFEAAAAEALDPARFEEAGIDEITRTYANLLVRHFRERRVEILQVLRYVQSSAESKEKLKRFNQGVHDRMRALLSAKSAADERRINLALFVAGAAARDAVLTSNLEVYPLTVDDAILADEIARSMAAYLRS